MNNTLEEVMNNSLMDLNPPVIRPGCLAVFVAWVKMWAFVPLKFVIGIGYVAIICEGLRMVVPALGIKLYRLPLLSALKDYEVWHKLDLAIFAGMLLFALSSWIWCVLLEGWLYDRAGFETSGRNATKYERCLLVVGGVILFSDACLFYRAMTFVGWGGEAFSATALICTLAYLAVLVSVCAVSVNLKRNYVFLKRGR